MALQIKQGTNVQRLAMVLLAGEPFYVTDATDAGVSPMWIGDGTTYGGVPTLDIKNLHDLTDVNFTSLAGSNIMQYDSSVSQWKNTANLNINGTAVVSGATQLNNTLYVGQGATVQGVTASIGALIGETGVYARGLLDASNNDVKVVQDISNTSFKTLTYFNITSDASGNVKFNGSNMPVLATGTPLIVASYSYAHVLTGMNTTTIYYAFNSTTNGFNIATSYANAVAGTYFTTTANHTTGNNSDGTSGGQVCYQPDVGLGVANTYSLPTKINDLPNYLPTASNMSAVVKTTAKYTDATYGAQNASYSIAVMDAGALPSTPQLVLDHSGNVTVSNSIVTPSISTAATTANVFNTTATTVNMAGAATTVNIGASTGTTTVNNNLTVGGNLVVNGTTTSVNSTTVNLEDPIVVVGGGVNGALLTSNDSKDRGIGFQYYTTSPGLGFFGWDNATGTFKFLTNATITNNVATGTAADLTAGQVYGSAGYFPSIKTTSGDVSIFPYSKQTNIGSSSIGSQQFNVYGDLYARSEILTDGDLVVNNNVYVYNDIITTNTGTTNLFNTNTTTLNIGGAATTVNIGKNTGEAGGTTSIGNNVVVGGDLQVGSSYAEFTVNSATGNTRVKGDFQADGTSQLNIKDGSFIKGALTATQNTSYTVPSPVLNTVSGNNGIDIVSSSGGTNGYSASATVTQYFGDTTAGTNTSPGITIRSANGTNSSPSITSSSNSLGVINFSGYSGSNFASYVASQGQGGGTTALHPIQIRAYTTESFAEGTTSLQITGGSISAGTATVTYATQSAAPFAVGAVITVYGNNISGLNGSQTVTACTTTQVQFATGATGSLTSTGSVSITNVTNAGSGFQVRAFPANKSMSTANRINLIDLQSGNASMRSDTITFQQGNASTNHLVLNSSKAQFTNPVQFPNYTASALRAITGAVGWTACVSDSQGRLAYWNTSSSSWKFVVDDSAV